MAKFFPNPDFERALEEQVQRDLVQPLQNDLNALVESRAGRDKAEIRRAVEEAFRRHSVEPGHIDDVVERIHAGPAGE